MQKRYIANLHAQHPPVKIDDRAQCLFLGRGRNLALCHDTGQKFTHLLFNGIRMAARQEVDVS